MDEQNPPQSPRDPHSPRDHYSPQPALAREAPPTARQSYDQASQFRLSRLLWVLGILLVLLLGPWVVQRFQYAATYGRERARVDVATGALHEIDVSGVGETSRLVAQAAGPSVVHIRTVQIVNGGRASDEWAFLMPRRRAAEGQGSGVIIDEEGYIVTNSHVISGAAQISVQLVDGRRVPARVIGADVLTDIAVLKIDADKLITAKWGDSETLEVGDLVWAVGSPYGLERSVTFGIISAKGRRGVTQSLYQDFLQTDAAVNPGNSGGPLVNVRGEVIGINTAIVGPAYQGISFAIPSSIAVEVYERLRETGRVARGWLGVELREITPEIAQQLDLKSTEGVLVMSVVDGSPAEDGGLQRGDVILEWNGEPTPDPFTLSRLVAATEIGSTVDVVVRREGAEVELKVRVGERPQP